MKQNGQPGCQGSGHHGKAMSSDHMHMPMNKHVMHSDGDRHDGLRPVGLHGKREKGTEQHHKTNPHLDY
jgi:hypothetical protein